MKSSFPLMFLACVMLVFAGCTNLSGSGAVPTPSGDIIATAVAGTLAASSAKTATLVAQIQQTALAVTPSPTPTLVNTPAATATETPTQVPAPVLPQGHASTIAFVGAGNNVWVWRDGHSNALTQSGDVAEVAVSDDGRFIAFTRSTDFLHYALWVIGADGQGERALVDTQAFGGMPLAPGAVSVAPVMFNWAPGSHTLAFTTRPMFEGPGLMLSDDLWLVNADTLERTELLPAGKGGKFYYSPDGKQIALVKKDSISLINADGSNLREAVLTFPVVSTYSEYFYYPAPVWLPDGSGLRVAIPPQAALEHPEDSTAIWEILLAGAAAQKIGSVPTAPLKFPQLSPDGSQIAYLKQVGEASENRSELHIASVDGASDSVYTSESVSLFVSWAPDTHHFFFTVGGTNRPFIGSPGASPQPMLDVITAVEVRWTDSAHFLFVTRAGSSTELRQGDLTGSSQVLASFTADEGRPLLYDFDQ